MKSAILTGLALAATMDTTNAWWCDGHMLTANVALRSGIMSQASISSALTILQTINQWYPTSPDFVTAACWADDLKSQGATEEANWHFVDLPVLGADWNGPIPGIPDSGVVDWAIDQAHATTYSKKSTAMDKARQLRFIIHFVGDIHQPLHAAAYYSKQFPSGDAGGNLWQITGGSLICGQTELHALWDSGLCLWPTDIVRPLNTTGQAWLDTMADKIIAANPASSFTKQLKITNTTLWAEESNQIAEDFVYAQVPASGSGIAINASYIDQGQTLAMERIAIGGYRLATLIEYILSSTKFGKDAQDQIRELTLHNYHPQERTAPPSLRGHKSA